MLDKTQNGLIVSKAVCHECFMLTQGYACVQIECEHFCLNRFPCDFIIASSFV